MRHRLGCRCTAQVAGEGWGGGLAWRPNATKAEHPTFSLPGLQLAPALNTPGTRASSEALCLESGIGVLAQPLVSCITLGQGLHGVGLSFPKCKKMEAVKRTAQETEEELGDNWSQPPCLLLPLPAAAGLCCSLPGLILLSTGSFFFSSTAFHAPHVLPFSGERGTEGLLPRVHCSDPWGRHCWPSLGLGFSVDQSWWLGRKRS